MGRVVNGGISMENMLSYYDEWARYALWWFHLCLDNVLYLHSNGSKHLKKCSEVTCSIVYLG